MRNAPLGEDGPDQLKVFAIHGAQSLALIAVQLDYGAQLVGSASGAAAAERLFQVLQQALEVDVGAKARHGRGQGRLLLTVFYGRALLVLHGGVCDL